MGIRGLFIVGETATMVPMSIPKLFLLSADPAMTKQVAGLLGGLDGQLIEASDLARSITPEAREQLRSIDALRAYVKHLIESIEPFLPGGHILLPTTDAVDAPADVLTEAVRRAVLWGRHTSMVMPVTLGSIEAGNMLSRMGNSLVFAPVCSIDQVAAILSATEEAAPEQICLIFPVADLRRYQVALAPFVRAVQQLCTDASREIQLMLQVEDYATFIWAIQAGVTAVAASPEIFTEWVAADKPMVPDAATLAQLESGTAVTAPRYDLSGEKNSFTISHPLTDALLRAQDETIAAILQ